MEAPTSVIVLVVVVLLLFSYRLGLWSGSLSASADLLSHLCYNSELDLPRGLLRVRIQSPYFNLCSRIVHCMYVCTNSLKISFNIPF